MNYSYVKFFFHCLILISDETRVLRPIQVEMKTVFCDRKKGTLLFFFIIKKKFVFFKKSAKQEFYVFAVGCNPFDH